MQTLESISQRRPMFTRNWNISKSVSHLLVTQNVSPNAISIVGVMGGIVAGAGLAATSLPELDRAGFAAAIAGILVRGAGNLMDGMVAVESGKASRVGELYNEIPDRVSDAAMLIGAGFSMGASPLLGMFTALLAVFVAYIRAQGKVSGAPQEYCGPMGKPGRITAIVLACLVGVTAPEIMKPGLVSIPPGWSLMNSVLVCISIGCVITAYRRLKRIASALRKREASS